MMLLVIGIILLAAVALALRLWIREITDEDEREREG